MKYRKKPVVIEAWQWLGGAAGKSKMPTWIEVGFDKREKAPGAIRVNPELPRGARTLRVHTLEGGHIAQPGDYIIQGIKGELYPCKPDIFEMTYEKVEEVSSCA